MDTENSIVHHAQEEYDDMMGTPEQEALLEIMKLEFQRKLLSSVDARVHHFDWDDLAVLVFEDDDFAQALFEALHSHPELLMSQLVRKHAAEMAEDLELGL